MDSSLKSSPYCRIELPGNVCSAKNEDTFRVAAYTVHLDEELCFYAAGSFRLAFATRSAESVDFVDENDGGFIFAGHVEELLY